VAVEVDPAIRHRRQFRRPVTRIASALVLAAAFAVVAAGCGGQSAEEKWAGNVCSDIGDWKSQIRKSANDARDKLQSPGAGTLTAVQADVQSAVEATNKLASNLRSLSPPNTDEGRQAKQQLDSLASQLKTSVAKARQAIGSLPKGADISTALQKLAPLATSLQSLSTSVSNTLQSVKATGSKIKDGFNKADSCKQFR
jgi:hypothetical protein